MGRLQNKNPAQMTLEVRQAAMPAENQCQKPSKGMEAEMPPLKTQRTNGNECQVGDDGHHQFFLRDLDRCLYQDTERPYALIASTLWIHPDFKMEPTKKDCDIFRPEKHQS